MGIVIDPSSCGDSSAPVKLTSQMLGFLSVLAISGSVALLSLKKDKIWNYVFDDEHLASESSPSQATENIQTPPSQERGNGEEARLSKKKKVRFAPDVVDPTTDGSEYRLRCIDKHRGNGNRDPDSARVSHAKQQRKCSPADMPANRIALYEGLKRSRMRYGRHC